MLRIIAVASMAVATTAAATTTAPPRYWAWPQNGELDGDIDGHDVDFEDPKNSTGSNGEQIVKGVFDGPGGFNGTYQATLNSNGSQVLELKAQGEDHKLDIKIDVAADGTITATSEGRPITLTIKGSGTKKDPFSITHDGHTLKWTIERGELDTGDGGGDPGEPI
jgi:hypothetical protein